MKSKFLFLIPLVVCAFLLAYILLVVPDKKHEDFLAHQHDCYQAGVKKVQSDKDDVRGDSTFVLLGQEYVYDKDSERCLYKYGSIYSSSVSLESYYIINIYTNQTLAFYLKSKDKIIGGDKKLYDETDTKYFK